ncbi:hypothetical protein PMIN03_000982 [Paraphaeosphaeria minitans]
MLFRAILFLSASAWAFPQSGDDLRTEDPNSPLVIEALTNPEVYEFLTRHEQRLGHGLQSPIKNVVHAQRNKKCGAATGCPAWEGEVRELNGREYRLYCFNAPWGSYQWLPPVQSLEECEQQCHNHQLDCNGLTYYPSTKACSVVYSKDAAPYVFDNGVQKFGAIPVKSSSTYYPTSQVPQQLIMHGNVVAFSAGMLCPLPGADNQVYDFGDSQEYQFKLSCRNQFRGSRRALGPVKNADECGERCGADKDCYGFLYYQPAFPGGRIDGARNCDMVMNEVNDGDWVPLYKPNQYLAGLRVAVSASAYRWTPRLTIPTECRLWR